MIFRSRVLPEIKALSKKLNLSSTQSEFLLDWFETHFTNVGYTHSFGSKSELQKSHDIGRVLYNEGFVISEKYSNTHGDTEIVIDEIYVFKGDYTEDEKN